MEKLNERILDDDYPVFWDYLYVCDGKVIRSDIQGNVKDLKRNLKCIEVKNCDIIGRQNNLAS